MIQLAKTDKEFLSIQEISQQENISSKYLEELIRPLKKQGLVISKRGVVGGYKLNKKANEISIKEIIEALDGPIQSVSCLSLGKKYKCLLEQKCYSKYIWGTIQNEVKETLAKMTLAKLLKQL